MKSKQPLQKGLPTISTASQSRLPLFYPLKKVVEGSGNKKPLQVKTANGTVTVRGPRLTQTHKDILEYIFCTLKPVGEIEESKSVAYNVSLYDLQKSLGVSTDNNRFYEGKLWDMYETSLTLEPSESPEVDSLSMHTDITFRVFSAVQRNKDDKGKIINYQVVFSEHFIKYLSGDLRVDYPELVDKLFKLKNAESKALVRMFLTHNWYKTKLSTAMALIGISEEHGFSRPNISRSKKRILSEADILESVFGIKFSDGRDPLLSYKKHESVYFKNGRADSLLNFNVAGKSSDEICNLIEKDKLSQESFL